MKTNILRQDASFYTDQFSPVSLRNTQIAPSETERATPQSQVQKEAQENPENYPAKRLSPRHWSAIWYWDEPIFSGGSKGTARAGLVIAPDGRGIPFKHNWGSAHSNGAFFAIADGSTRFGGQNIDWKVIRALLTPDGREIESNDGLYMLGIDFCHC